MYLVECTAVVRLCASVVRQTLDIWQGCFPYMLYWLEVQQMALQLAGGKPGPAAEAAALQLMEKVPHSALITR